EVDAVARKVGAVNTLQKRWNRLVGYNTDVEGAIRPLRRLLSLRGAKVGILGAGGAARALVYGLPPGGAEGTLFPRHRGRAEASAREVGGQVRSWSQASKFRGTVLIQATPVGMAPGPEESPVSWDGIKSEIAFDLVYRPPETRFLQEARRTGARTVSGIEMFLEQAIIQFEILCGTAPPRSLFEEILSPYLPTAGGGA